MSESVPAALAGQRLDRVVAMLTGLSRSDAADLVIAGGVLVDGHRALGKVKVLEGQVLEIVLPLPGPKAMPAADASVEVPVVFADSDVIVVDKPEGLVVHPGSGNEGGTLVNGLLALFADLAGVGDPERPGIVHRLDKGTSGLMVVARSPRAYDSLVDQLGRREVERRYVALVWGVPDAATGLVDAPIGRSPREPTRMAVVADGREARTRYELQRSFTHPAPCALMELRLETGRTHQIRVHLAAIGHPVMGDQAYGGAKAELVLPRPMLHAASLSFDHPGSGARMSFVAPWPADLVEAVASLSSTPQ